MNITIIGKHGGLAQALQQSLASHCVTSYSKEEYNLSDRSNIELLATKIYSSDVIICCTGVYDQNSWDTFITNTVGPIYLLELLTQYNSQAHVILLGSHAGSWTSWPGMKLSRLSYSNSKLALENYVMGLEHTKESKLKLTMFNPSRFQTSMSNDTGYSTEVITDAIGCIINTKIPPLVYELGSNYDQ